MTYLTPDRFRNMGLGSDVDALTDIEMASILERASAMVDSYCAVPNLPQKHSFKGGTITNESHTWRAGQVRIYPWHTPLKSVESFKVYATNSFHLEVQPDDIFIEPSGGFMELVALSMSPVGFWTASNLMSLTQPVSKIDYTYGYTFQAVGEMLSITDAGEYRAQNQFWDTSDDPVIYVNEVATASGFSVDSYEGVVVFDPQLSASDRVSADYTYTLPPGVAQATAAMAQGLLSNRDLITRGMGGLDAIRVEEIELRRFGGGSKGASRGTAVASSVVPDEAAALLGPYRFISVM